MVLRRTYVLKPAGASDDGVHTRLRFAANADLPAIFVRNEDGSESLLNFSMDAGDVIVHRVAKRFILRRGRLIGCVINKGFAGGGTRLDVRNGGARMSSAACEAACHDAKPVNVPGERGYDDRQPGAIHAISREQYVGDRPCEHTWPGLAGVVLRQRDDPSESSAAKCAGTLNEPGSRGNVPS